MAHDGLWTKEQVNYYVTSQAIEDLGGSTPSVKWFKMRDGSTRRVEAVMYAGVVKFKVTQHSCNC